MEKTKLIYVVLSEEQIEEIKKVNKFKKKINPTHAIIWEGHGQIFGDKQLISRFWDNWAQELTEKEKESHTYMRGTFLDCIKDDDYKFENYIEKNFREEIIKIDTKLAKELNAKRMSMVDEEYQKALEIVKSEAQNNDGEDRHSTKMIFITAIIAIIAAISVITAVIESK